MIELAAVAFMGGAVFALVIVAAWGMVVGSAQIRAEQDSQEEMSYGGSVYEEDREW